MKRIVVSLLCVFTTCDARIVEVATLQDVLIYVDPAKKTAVACDVDNTLVHPASPCGTGSDQWLTYHAERYVTVYGVDKGVVWELLLPIYYDIQISNHFQLTLIEDITLSVVQELQKRADKVVALTARSCPIMSATIRLLDEIGIDFSKNAFNEVFSFTIDGAHYNKGICFCGPNDKGKVLAELFQRMDYTPECIIMIDDKKVYLEKVEKAFEGTGIEVIGIHYVHLAEQVKNFVPAHQLHQ